MNEINNNFSNNPVDFFAEFDFSDVDQYLHEGLIPSSEKTSAVFSEFEITKFEEFPSLDLKENAPHFSNKKVEHIKLNSGAAETPKNAIKILRNNSVKQTPHEKVSYFQDKEIKEKNILKNESEYETQNFIYTESSNDENFEFSAFSFDWTSSARSDHNAFSSLTKNPNDLHVLQISRNKETKKLEEIRFLNGKPPHSCKKFILYSLDKEKNIVKNEVDLTSENIRIGTLSEEEYQTIHRTALKILLALSEKTQETEQKKTISYKKIESNTHSQISIRKERLLQKNALERIPLKTPKSRPSEKEEEQAMDEIKHLKDRREIKKLSALLDKLQKIKENDFDRYEKLKEAYKNNKT